MSTTPTPSQAKQRVLEWVRSKNPQTMELKRGCKVRYSCNGHVEYWYPSKDGKGKTQARDGYSERRVPIYDHEKKWEEIIWSDEIMCKQVPERWKNHYWALVTRFTDGTMYVKYLNFEILGSDMGLQELLIALRDVIGIQYCDELGWMSRLDGTGKAWQYDLKNNLHDQSDAFYQSLLPLLP